VDVEASAAHDSSNVSRDVSDGAGPKTDVASEPVHVEEPVSVKTDGDSEIATELHPEAGKHDHIDPSDQAEAVKDDDDPPGLGISSGSLKRTASFTSTVPDDDCLSEQGVTDLITNREPGSPDTVPDIQEPPTGGDDDFSLSGGTETSAATTLVSTNTSGAYGDLSFASVSVSTRPDSKSVLPSANRLSISYADGNKRLLINAEVVKTLKVFRSESRVEVQINLEHNDSGDLKGILVRQWGEIFVHLLMASKGRGAFRGDQTVPHA
jgi:20S proteasome subunit alpha 6